MDPQRQALRAGATAIALAVFLRLLGGGFFAPLGNLWENPTALSLLVYLQTGRAVRFPQPQPPTTEAPATVPPTTAPPVTAPPLPEKPVFTSEDVGRVPVTYGCSYRPDISALLCSPLDWDLTGDAPTVLIVHTHATEAYTQTPGAAYVEDSAYRTLDDRYNMVSVGDEVARVLEAGGIHVLHDRTHHDYPSYNGAYGNARVSIEEYLRQYPSIRMVLDIHRDASDGAGGSQLTTSGTVSGQPASQIMILVGTDSAGGYHPRWQENLSVGLKLSALLERENPGLTRAVNVYPHRLNMDKTTGSLLIEIGAAGDTHEQAILAANALARSILALAKGAG